ncbi:MAG: SH3 domain-containing protein [Lentisphaeria bacterium]|jgi:SH3-like domain-containing protein|nr:SH3 domain-containing protein [Lentisphaeria bacterium]
MSRFWHTVLAILAAGNLLAAEPRTGIVTTGSLNVRAKAARHFERIGKFERGDTVQVVGEDSEWLEVIVPPDAKAWVARQHLDAKGTVTATNLQVRSGPGVVFTPYAEVPQGTALKLIGPPMDEWQQILPPPGATGWVSRAYVRIQEQPDVATQETTVVVVVPEPEAKPETPVAAETKPEVVVPVPEKKPEVVVPVPEQKPEVATPGPEKKPEAVVPVPEPKPEVATPVPEKKPEAAVVVADKKPEVVVPVTEKKPEVVVVVVDKKPEIIVVSPKSAEPPPAAAVVAPQPVETAAAVVPNLFEQPAETTLLPPKPTETPVPRKTVDIAPLALADAQPVQPVAEPVVAASRPSSDIVLLPPIMAPDSPVLERPTTPPARYTDPIFIAEAKLPPPAVQTARPEPPAVPEQQTVVPVAPPPPVQPAPDTRPRFEGLVFSLKEEAVPEASHILYRREGTVCSPVCYLRSDRIQLAQWEMREVVLYGEKIEIPGWSRPVLDVRGIQLKTLE